MDCQIVRNNLVAFLDKELSEREHLLVEAHIQGCASCAREKLKLTESWRLLDRDSPRALKADFTSSVMARVQSQQPSSGEAFRWLGRRGLLWVGGFICVVIFVMFIRGKNAGLRENQEPQLGEEWQKEITVKEESLLPMPAVSVPEKDLPVSANPLRPEQSVVPVMPLVPQVLPSLVRNEIDQDIIANLDLYENTELLQEMDLINDLDVVSRLGGSAS